MGHQVHSDFDYFGTLLQITQTKKFFLPLVGLMF